LPGEPVRELHIDKGADVADLRPIQQHMIAPVVLHEAGGTRTLFVACRHYAGEKLDLHTQLTQHPAGKSFHILTALQGEGIVLADGCSPVELSAGESVLVPACIERYNIDPVSPLFTLIKAYVPDLQSDVIEPLLARGIAPAQIAQLGGDALRTDIRIGG